MAERRTHLGVYALIVYGDAVILVRKGRGPYSGKWDLPGGRIEFGETPQEALEREVREETGLEIAAPELLDVVSTCFAHLRPDGTREELHHIGVIYHVTLQSIAGLKAAPDGHDSLGSQLVPLREALALELTPFAQLAIKRVV